MNLGPSAKEMSSVGGRLERGYPADDLITIAFDMPADMLGEALEWDLHCIVLFSWVRVSAL